MIYLNKSDSLSRIKHNRVEIINHQMFSIDLYINWKNMHKFISNVSKL